MSKIDWPNEGGGEAPLAADLLEGADEIARFLFKKRKGGRRRVYHLHETRQLPLFRIGNNICGRKSRLLQHIKDQEDEALDEREAQAHV